MSSWGYEFGPEYDIPADRILATGLEDYSWHNDACPSFIRQVGGNEVHDLRLWVEHVDPQQRELGPDCGRYVVNYYSDTPVDGVPISEDGSVYEGDDLEEALAKYLEAHATIEAGAR